MIENQLRAGGIHAQFVFDTVNAVPRENFVPENWRKYTFADMAIPLPCGQHMQTPLTEALILQAISPNKNDKILEIGTGSGHMAALLAHRAQHVTSVEIEAVLKIAAEKNLAQSGIHNVHILHGNGFLIDQYAQETLFNSIVFSGAIPAIPVTFAKHLAPNGKMIIFRGSSSFSEALLLQKEAHSIKIVRHLFETAIKSLKKLPKQNAFPFYFSESK